jgi:hypothetical protein
LRVSFRALDRSTQAAALFHHNLGVLSCWNEYAAWAPSYPLPRIVVIDPLPKLAKLIQDEIDTGALSAMLRAVGLPVVAQTSLVPLNNRAIRMPNLLY